MAVDVNSPSSDRGARRRRPTGTGASLPRLTGAGSPAAPAPTPTAHGKTEASRFLRDCQQFPILQ